MKKPILCLLAAAMLITLFGCGVELPPETSAPTVPTGPVETTQSAPTAPPDGNPDDVTCKGSYTGQVQADVVVARASQAELTAGELQAWYWAEVADYCQSGNAPAPDLSLDLSVQECPLEGEALTWQQYFLKRALNSWHTAQALICQGLEEGLPVEEAFQPNRELYEEYNVTKVPANQYLYRYTQSYSPNTMHQAYLDGMDDLLAELAGEQGYSGMEELASRAFGCSVDALKSFTLSYNWAYMYFTNLSYYIQPEQEAVEAYFAEQEAEFAARGVTRDGSRYVSIRQILLVPQDDPEGAGSVSVAEDGTVTCSEESWAACEDRAEKLLQKWKSNHYGVNEGFFGDFAYHNSADPGTASDGGAYTRIRQGQLIQELDSWSFDQSREEGDTAVVRSPYGYHVVYFSGSQEIWYAEAEDALTAREQTGLITAAREAYPMEVDYSAITLGAGEPTVSAGDLLYPDVAHERFPEIPLYLQQDYPDTMYGSYRIRTHGCGITTLAMVASYMVDDELTPPEMCALYGRYSTEHGSDNVMFIREPPVLGFYLKEYTYKADRALEALKEGHVVISLQSAGYWTQGGHFLALEKYNEDGTIQVRDSNLYNYGRLERHMQDSHEWSSITADDKGYWIFEYKVTAVPACSRCGQPEGVTTSLLQEDYLCEKCRSAVLRRDTFLTCAGE